MTITQKLTSLRAAAAVLVLAVLATVLPAPAGAAEGKVNINTAGVEQLTYLPRVGPAVAQRIIEFRDDNGPFKTLDDLMLVRGIGERTYELIAPYASLGGETTLTEKVRTSRAADSGGQGESAPASEAPSN